MLRRRSLFASLLILSVACISGITPATAAEYVPFDGSRSVWHEDFERHDYVMDEATLKIVPFTAPEGERFGVKDPAPGQRRCIVVVPKNAAPGNPWSWQGCYWDHQPQTEVELLRRGFHIAYISSNATLKPGKEWDAWYEFLTKEHGLSPKPAFIGMSRGGEYAYTWATAHPDKVSCIYADNPAGNREVFSKLVDLAANDVPLLTVNGSIDPLLGRFSNTIETMYRELGGRISVMIKDGAAHHPHSLRDPKLLADFITQSVQEQRLPQPAYLLGKTTRLAYYSGESSYREFPGEGLFITSRGPQFVECYDRYTFELAGVEGAIGVIAPRNAAAGMPWVFRAGVVEQNAVVDLALLAKGFHIVTGPVSYNMDGPKLEHWNAVHEHLVKNGFSKKPLMEGAGRAAGEVYAWAIANPDKVSGIYAENPVLRAFMSRGSLIENLAPLAKAGVPLLHVAGSLDPAFENTTRVVEKRYKELGGNITILVKEGEAHYPLAPRDPKPVVTWALEKAGVVTLQ